LIALTLWCATPIIGYSQRSPGMERSRHERVRPGISVLLDERMGLIRGRRVGLVTDQAGVDEHGTPDAELLTNDSRARKARVSLVARLSPENVPPPDSLLRGVETLIVDLQDIGTRTWTGAGAMLYTMRAAARHHIPVLVLDRPNPITGLRPEGPMLDSSIANPNDPSPTAPANPSALYPVPLRHGMTMGELAQLLNAQLKLGADLTVVPVRGWQRDAWFDQTGLPWIRPSPDLPSLTSVLLYVGLVAFEATNVSVGRGTGEAFQRVGAPWLHAHEVVDLLRDRLIPGVKFDVDDFTPEKPADGKYAGRRIAGIRIHVSDRDRLNPSRVGAALLWAIAKTSPDSLQVRAAAFDELFGTASVRVALLHGEDPDAVLDRDLPAVIAFRESARPFFLYR
jgi:uncharacterized protein YbbC (DUF1343 family)